MQSFVIDLGRLYFRSAGRGGPALEAFKTLCFTYQNACRPSKTEAVLVLAKKSVVVLLQNSKRLADVLHRLHIDKKVL